MTMLKRLVTGVMVVCVLAFTATTVLADDIFNWKLHAFKASWTSVAYSGDGSTAVAVVEDGYIYRSTDSGLTWSQVKVVNASSAGGYLGPRKWMSVASSDNGQKLAVAQRTQLDDGNLFGGHIYTSTDSGATWTPRGSDQIDWISIASSSNGNKLVAASEKETTDGGYIYTSSDSGATWTARSGAGNHNWVAVASSADGTRLIAADDGGETGDGGYIYLSTNSGAAWTALTSAGSRSWTAVASSGDGTHLAASDDGGTTSDGGYIYISTDSGATWTAQTLAGLRVWQSVAISGNGTGLIAADATGDSGEGGYIYTSANFGTTWTERVFDGKRPWTAVSSSADGTKFLAAWGEMTGEDGAIFASVDSGATWKSLSGPGTGEWIAVASSSDGTKLIAAHDDPAAATGGSLYGSTDSGATWTELTGAGAHHWTAVASSADGVKLIAADGSLAGTGGYLYTSIDSGATWTERTGAGQRYWIAVSSAADGTKLVAADESGTSEGGYIYTSADSGANWTEQTSAGTVKWSSLASSADGSKVVAGDQAGFVLTSSDYGSTWILPVDSEQNPIPVGKGWMSVAMSSDGNKMIAAAMGDDTGGLYISTDFGRTWPPVTGSITQHTWQGVSSSADGSKLAAVDNLISGVIVSTDSGASFTSEVATYFNDWTAVASSSFGNKLIAAADNALYTAYSDYPVVDSPVSSNISSSTATLGATIESTGGASIIAAGVAYGTSANPTISDSKVTTGTRSGAYTVNVTGLSANTTYHFRGYATNSAGTSYTGDATFTTSAAPPPPPISITVTSPGSGSSWVAGSKQTINWTYTGSPGSKVRIELLKSGGTVATIASSASIGKNSSGSYSWTSKSTLAKGDDYTVRVTSTSNGSYSGTSNTFTVVGPEIKSVSIGSTATSGDKCPISWTYTGTPGNVRIELIGGSGGIIKPSLSAGKSGAGSYTWSIPKTLATGDYQVKVTATANSECTYTSGTVHIEGPKITGVSVSQNVTSGGKCTISWNYTGNPGNVKITLNNGAVVRASTSAGKNYAGSYTWTVPKTQATGDYTVTVTAVASSIVTNTSGTFHISGPTISGVSVNSGSYTAGGKMTISWQYTGSPGNVRIELFGSASATIKSSISAGKNGAGSYTWTIPKTQSAGNAYQVRVTATADGSITDTNDTPFSIGSVQAAAGPDQQTKASAVVSLVGLNSTGATESSASYQWTQIAGPKVELSDPHAAETVFLAPESDTEGASLGFQLTVVTGEGVKSEDSCIVNVSENLAAPVAEAGQNQVVLTAQIVELDGSGSSVSSSIVSYSWRQVSGIPVTLTDASAMQTTFVAPDVSAAGEAVVFELTVTDQSGLRARDTCIVNVITNDRPPIAQAGLSRTVPAGSEVLLDGSGSTDTDNGIASYRWRQVSGKPVVLSAPQGMKTAFIAPDVDSLKEDLVFELTVTDTPGLQDKSKVVITVVPATGAGK